MLANEKPVQRSIQWLSNALEVKINSTIDQFVETAKKAHTDADYRKLYRIANDLQPVLHVIESTNEKLATVITLVLQSGTIRESSKIFDASKKVRKDEDN